MIYQRPVEGWYVSKQILCQVARLSSGMAWILRQRPIEWIGAWMMNLMDKGFVLQIISLGCFRWLRDVFQGSSYSDLRCSVLIPGSYSSSQSSMEPSAATNGRGHAAKVMRKCMFERSVGHIVIQNIMAHNHMIRIVNKHGTTKTCPSVIRVHSGWESMAAFLTWKNVNSSHHDYWYCTMVLAENCSPVAAVRCAGPSIHQFALHSTWLANCLESAQSQSIAHLQIIEGVSQCHLESTTEWSWRPGGSQTCLQTWKTLKVYWIRCYNLFSGNMHPHVDGSKDDLLDPAFLPLSHRLVEHPQKIASLQSRRGLVCQFEAKEIQSTMATIGKYELIP